MNVSHVELAKKALDPGVGSAKSKRARSKPFLMHSNIIETLNILLRLNHEVILSIDS